MRIGVTLQGADAERFKRLQRGGLLATLPDSIVGRMFISLGMEMYENSTVNSAAGQLQASMMDGGLAVSKPTKKRRKA